MAIVVEYHRMLVEAYGEHALGEHFKSSDFNVRKKENNILRFLASGRIRDQCCPEYKKRQHKVIRARLAKETTELLN